MSGLIEAAARNAVVPGGFVFSSVGRFQGCIGFCQVWSAGNRVSDGISHLICLQLERSVLGFFEEGYSHGQVEIRAGHSAW